MILVSVDPGGTTGLCKISWDGGKPYTLLQSIEFTWGNRFLVPEWIDSVTPDVVVMESFHLYGHEAQNLIGSDFPSCQIIGMVEARLWESHLLGKLVYQPAYNTKGVRIPVEHVAAIGASEHRKDAYKHLRYYIAKNQKPSSKIAKLINIPVRKTK